MKTSLAKTTCGAIFASPPFSSAPKSYDHGQADTDYKQGPGYTDIRSKLTVLLVIIQKVFLQNLPSSIFLVQNRSPCSQIKGNTLLTCGGASHCDGAAE